MDTSQLIVVGIISSPILGTILIVVFNKAARVFGAIDKGNGTGYIQIEE